MKKIISGLLCFVVVFSNINILYATEKGSMSNFKEIQNYVDGQFTDVLPDDWYAENFKKSYVLGLMCGQNETIFSPDSNITIAETITLASRLHNVYTGNNYKFNNSEPWYQAYVDYAIENKIINSDDYIGYNFEANRAIFATIFASALPEKALKEINQIDDYFILDVPMLKDYAESVYKLYRAGILTGNDDKGTFAPDTNIKRSEVAAIVSRMADESLRAKVTFKLPKLHITDLGFSWQYIAKTIQYNGKYYSLQPHRVIFFAISDEPFVYIEDGHWLDSGCLKLVFESIKPSTDTNDNPFVDGTVYLYHTVDDSTEYKYKISPAYISPSKNIGELSIEYNGKIFKGLSGEEFLASNLDTQSSGIWNGVRFCFFNDWISYNLNDLAKYFGINRTIKFKDIDDGILIIND